MSPSTNTLSVFPTSVETTTLTIYYSTSYYVTQTDFATTIQVILYEFKKYIKNLTAEIPVQDAKFYNITVTITYQDEKFDNIKKQL